MESHQLTKVIAFLLLATAANSLRLIDNLLNAIVTDTIEILQMSSPTPYNPDTDLTTPQIAIRHGYPAEVHTIKTQDGYLLTMHRIPCGQSGCQTEDERGRRQPVLLKHGILESSVDWVMNGPGKALAFILADAGYDVWLGNARGNSYSRKHVTMSTKNSKFWDFSWHEMAIYDLPAEIDYIYDIKDVESYRDNLDERNPPRDLLYIGFSMGTTVAFVLLSSRPEYNDNILAAFALAPVAYMSQVRSPIRLLSTISKNMELNIKLLGNGDYLPRNEVTDYLVNFGCDLTDVEQYFWENTLDALFGYDRTQINSVLMPVFFTHNPAGTSTKTLAHYAQEVHYNGNFQQYDYGKIENMRRYGYEKPPLYNISNIVTPFAFFYAQNDALTGPRDIERLYNSLQGTRIGLFKVPDDKFNHADFIFGIDAPKLVYAKLVQLLGGFR